MYQHKTIRYANPTILYTTPYIHNIYTDNRLVPRNRRMVYGIPYTSSIRIIYNFAALLRQQASRSRLPMPTRLCLCCCCCECCSVGTNIALSTSPFKLVDRFACACLCRRRRRGRRRAKNVIVVAVVVTDLHASDLRTQIARNNIGPISDNNNCTPDCDRERIEEFC